MTEREQALKIANMWLDFEMNALTQMVPGDPDCNACVVGRQLIRMSEENDRLKIEIVAGAIARDPALCEIDDTRSTIRYQG